MKKKTVFKLLLDIVMLILYALLMFADGLGAFFHEAVGIGVGVLFTVHVLLNRDMLRGVARTAEDGARRGRALVTLALDEVLMFGMPFVIGTGILIARTLFDLGIDRLWDSLLLLHNVLAWVCLAAMALHVAVHARYLVRVGASAARQLKTPAVRKTMSRFAAGTMAAGMLYMLVYAIYRGRDALPETAAVTVTETYTPATADAADTAVSAGTAASTETAVSAGTAASTETAASTGTAASSESSDDKSSAAGTAQADAAPVVTLSDYLSKLYCTGCHNHCPLTSPRCGRGEQQAQQAEQEYTAAYGDQ